MAALAEEIGGTPDWRPWSNRLRDDHPASMDELLRCYRGRDGPGPRVRAGERGHVHPRGRGVRGGAGAALPPGRRPGGLLLPAALLRAALARDVQRALHARRGQPEEQEARLRSNSFFEIPGVTAHEAYPGHHLHFAASQGTNALRQVLHSTYMIEGWGLYVENMMGEHGYYPRPRRLGQLSMRLFRAGRIVVDTSLHLGEMSIDEATTFMAERCGFPCRRPTARCSATARIPPRPRPT
jgi:hypothetical protein